MRKIILDKLNNPEFVKLGDKKKDTVTAGADRGGQEKQGIAEKQEKAFNDIKKGGNSIVALAFNERLVEVDDTHARTRKFKGLLSGLYCYKENKAEAIILNNQWAAEGDKSALGRKITGRAFRLNGYEKTEGFLGKYIEFLKSAKAIKKLALLKSKLELQESDFKAGKYRL